MPNVSGASTGTGYMVDEWIADAEADLAALQAQTSAYTGNQDYFDFELPEYETPANLSLSAADFDALDDLMIAGYPPATRRDLITIEITEGRTATDWLGWGSVVLAAFLLYKVVKK